MSRTMETLKKHRERLYKRIIPCKTKILIDGGAYKGREGIIQHKIHLREKGNGYFRVFVELLDDGKGVEIGGDNIEILEYSDYKPRYHQDYEIK